MGATLNSDIPGLRDIVRFDHASLASNGANALTGIVMVAPQAIEVLAATWVPADQDQTANAASYRRITLNNGTVVISSVNLTASVASLATQALSGTATLAAGVVLNMSQITVGAAHTTGTILAAGTLQVEYRLL